MVDVRTRAEWTFVGLPDVPGPEEQLFLAEWQGFPSGAPDPGFAEKLARALSEAGIKEGTPIYFICRSGARSASAAAAMTAAGFSPCFNVAGGFEGDRDDKGQRGHLNGWKATGLPWSQS